MGKRRNPAQPPGRGTARRRSGISGGAMAAVAAVAALAVLLAIWFGTGPAPDAPAGGSGGPAGTTAGDTAGVPARSGGRTVGRADAPVVVEMYSDFQCPHCATAAREVVPPLLREYADAGQVRFVARYFPILGPGSTLAAEAAACADRQGRFWAYHDELFRRGESGDRSAFTLSGLHEIAGDLGLDGARFRSCLENHETRGEVQADYDQGTRLGVRATPTFLINGVKIEGALPYAEIKRLVDVALKEKR
ncbi:DsbA family protein [Caldinitratiruptor microaerophilus]|uniref:Thioredoxin domain-containing protein n=1 Tax=Caldinitratiruptor microaerophilus TaxID=671077 RepID=A0AA35CKM0_9FIRM|nr:DsbA family protein [Caldinitratiruptor microaerophilus]BDG61034.1 hypothetical protein caldi_21240 [Caldinitratiruptor microaerophilus]